MQILLIIHSSLHELDCSLVIKVSAHVCICWFWAASARLCLTCEIKQLYVCVMVHFFWGEKNPHNIKFKWKVVRVPFIFLLTKFVVNSIIFLSLSLSKRTNTSWSGLLFVWSVVVVNLCCFDRCTHHLQTQRTSTEIPRLTLRLNLPAVCLQALSLVSSKRCLLCCFFFFFKF